MKKIKITESQLKSVIKNNTVVSEQSKITSGGSQDNMIALCADLGVKTVGYCDTMAKKPIKSCAEMGIKTPGFCYVDTKQPVPGIKKSNGNTIKEQSLAALQSGNGPGWWEEFGCIMDGIDGIKKEQGGEGTLFILSKDGNRYALVNTVYHKPDPALVKKVQSVNPNIKTFGKAINLKDKNEALVYYCQVKARGGIRVVGDNYTVEPPRQSKPAAQPAKPVHYNQSATNTSSANPAPINEEVRRIKKMMGVLNEQKEYEEDFDNDGIKFGDLAFPRCTTWGIEVQVKDADYASSTTVTVYVEFNNDGDFVRVVEIDNQSDREDEEIVELVEYAIRNGKLDGKIPDFISYNMETGEFDTN